MGAIIPYEIPDEELRSVRFNNPKIYPVRHIEEIKSAIEELVDVFAEEFQSPDPQIPFDSFIPLIEQEVLDELWADCYIYKQEEWTKELSDYAREQIIGRFTKEIQGMRKYVYYAHCMKDYGSNKAKEHKRILMEMGFNVLDPSEKPYSSISRDMKRSGKSGKEIMDFFLGVVQKHADVLAFSTTDNGEVSAGVAKEIEEMKKKNGLIIQMPDLSHLKVMSVSETRKYIQGA